MKIVGARLSRVRYPLGGAKATAHNVVSEHHRTIIRLDGDCPAFLTLEGNLELAPLGVPDELLPLQLEAVLERLVGRHVLPGLEKVDRLRFVRVPDRFGRVHPVLGPAPRQPRHGRSMQV